MRIYDQSSKRQLNQITLFLTPDEARELADTAAQLAAHPDHSHVLDESLQRQITIAVYTPGEIAGLSQEAQDVIGDGSE
jgi:hypothetical protein